MLSSEAFEKIRYVVDKLGHAHLYILLRCDSRRDRVSCALLITSRFLLIRLPVILSLSLMVPKHERGSPSSTGQREAPAKRSRSPAKGPRVPPRAPASSSPYMSMFEGFRAELDEHQDRRERVIKSSRDVTAASKKMYLLSPA